MKQPQYVQLADRWDKEGCVRIAHSKHLVLLLLSFLREGQGGELAP